MSRIINTNSWRTWVILMLLTGCISCRKLAPAAPGADTVLDGPMAGLTSAQLNQFIKGDIAFNDEIFTSETGLGPLFVASSCGTCHAGDGKGHPFSTLTRFGQSDSISNQFLQRGGPQLQHRALYNFIPEQIPAGASFSRFMPPANTGLGLLDAVTDADLIALSDPDDANGDGISGRPNWVPAPDFCTLRPGAVEQNGRYIGRFGKKAAAYDLLHQTVNAYNQDIGILSAFNPTDTYSGQNLDPEISNQTIMDVVAYLKFLKAPVQRSPSSETNTKGKQIFNRIGCNGCHLPAMKTGASPIDALAYKSFEPFTDLLLHDMGAALNDGYSEGSALPEEWRTPPLWGLGLSKKSQGGQYFLLHDGRAESIDAAIQFHGGEAASAQANYKTLSSEEKSNLIKFLESL